MRKEKNILILLLISMLILSVSSDIVSEENSKGIKILSIYGEAYYKQPGSQQWSKLDKDVIIGEDYIVKTEDSSYAEIELSPENRFRIKENSKIIVKDLYEKTKDEDGNVVKLVDFNLLDGDIVCKLDNLPKDTLLQVSSPTAVAGARGTAFRVNYSSGTKKSGIGVLESSVKVESRGEPEKSILVGQYKKVTVTPWSQAVASVRGTGILSEKILGKIKIEEAKKPLMKVVATSDTGKKAKERAYYKLYKRIMGISLSPQETIEDLVNQKPSLCETLYTYIAGAKIQSKKDINGEVEIVLELAVRPIANIINRALPPMPQVVEPISMGQYGKKFGALARVTTERAAVLDGYKKLAEKMYGTVITSDTTLSDMVVSDDRIVTTVKGVVKGAEILEKRYFSDGSVAVSMTIRADLVRTQLIKITGDIYGKNYFTSPRAIDIDDFLDVIY